MKKRVIIVDGNNALHRSYHKFKNMKSKKGEPSSIIYGFPLIISGLIRKFNPNHFVIAFDHSRNKHRMAALPNYKNREHRLDFDYEDFNKQCEIARKAMTALGIDYIRIKGQEADDIIYMLIKKYLKKGFTDIIIISSDKDFQQLITKEVSIWQPNHNRLLTYKNHESVFGYTVKQSLDYLILDGDKSDKIPGYRGMGEKKITAFLKEHTSIRKFLKSDKTHKTMSKEELEVIYKRNRLLIDIRYFCRKFIDKADMKITKGKKKIDSIYLSDLTNTYDIKTFMSGTFLKPFKTIIKK
jgi:DNA polymerase I